EVIGREEETASTDVGMRATARCRIRGGQLDKAADRQPVGIAHTGTGASAIHINRTSSQVGTIDAGVRWPRRHGVVVNNDSKRRVAQRILVGQATRVDRSVTETRARKAVENAESRWHRAGFEKVEARVSPEA